jgi:tetratricopeptide (TPR) repeat protein
MPSQRPWWNVVVLALLAVASAAAGQSSPPAPSDPVAPLVTLAEAAFRSGRLDEALQAYDRAHASAAQQGDADRAFDLAYLAAAIEHQRGRHAEALRRFREAALARPEHPRAPEAHRLAAYHGAQLAQAQTPADWNRYAALLDEYLRRWPRSPEANRTRRQLGHVYELQKNWSAAAAAYRATEADDPDFGQSVSAAGACYRAWIGELRTTGKPSVAIATEAAQWFESLVLDGSGRAPEVWVPLQRQAVLEAVRLWLEVPAGAGRAETLLRVALQGVRDPAPAWQSSARVLLISACATQGRRREAADQLTQLPRAAHGDLLLLVETLQRLADAASPDVRGELGAMELRAIELLEPWRAQLDASSRRTLERLAARAAADAGRNDQALAAYQALARAYPRDGTIQEDYARLLASRSDAASLTAARTRWLEIVAHSEPGSPRWFRAEYHVAELDYRLGNAQHARQILQRLEVLYPSMGGPELKSRFAALAQLLDQGK